MEDKRRFNRLDLVQDGAVVSCAGIEEKGKISDISRGGMKVFFSQPMEIGAVIHGQFRVLSDREPFFVKGIITRVVGVDNMWEVAVKFEKVSTIPLDA
ncbi:MAG: PilZ domain-containing protein [Candidatus Omnitrophica bacterium]|nr:PilZ domain-containing protein [Candidatus Omnitrophota bacterium]